MTTELKRLAEEVRRAWASAHGPPRSVDRLLKAIDAMPDAPPLSGYRALGAKCAELEEKHDRAVARSTEMESRYWAAESAARELWAAGNFALQTGGTAESWDALADALARHAAYGERKCAHCDGSGWMDAGHLGANPCSCPAGERHMQDIRDSVRPIMRRGKP